MTVGLRTLVLNNQWQPVSLFPLYAIAAEDAITRHLTGSGYVVAWYDRPILTPSSVELKWPSVIVNPSSYTYAREVTLKKDSLFYRDHCKCVYCGDDLTLRSGRSNTITVDHYIPRGAGGSNSWDNVVASCARCNERKGDSLPGREWRPSRLPWKPSFAEMLSIRSKFPITVDDESWLQFLPKFADVTVRPPKSTRKRRRRKRMEAEH